MAPQNIASLDSCIFVEKLGDMEMRDAKPIEYLSTP